jgi:hypothetical protein
MSWLGSAHGVDNGDPIELDLALFDLVTAFPNGFLPAGLVLAKRASDNVFGHYDPGTVAHESVSFAVDGTSGTWTISFDGETTAALAFDITAANLKLALEALSNVDVDDFTVTGGPGDSGGTTPYIVTASATGQYADQNIPNMTDADSLSGGGADVVVVITAGGGAGAGVAGLEVARGHLLTPINVIRNGVASTTGRRNGSLFTHGKVREAKLPTGHGLTAAAKLDMPLIQYI